MGCNLKDVQTADERSKQWIEKSKMDHGSVCSSARSIKGVMKKMMMSSNDMLMFTPEK